jgi:hypothetical protein
VSRVPETLLKPGRIRLPAESKVDREIRCQRHWLELVASPAFIHSIMRQHWSCQGAPIFDDAYQNAKALDPRNNLAVERAIAIHMCGRDEEIGMSQIASILQPRISRFLEW